MAVWCRYEHYFLHDDLCLVKESRVSSISLLLPLRHFSVGRNLITCRGRRNMLCFIQRNVNHQSLLYQIIPNLFSYPTGITGVTTGSQCLPASDHTEPLYLFQWADLISALNIWDRDWNCFKRSEKRTVLLVSYSLGLSHLTEKKHYLQVLDPIFDVRCICSSYSEYHLLLLQPLWYLVGSCVTQPWRWDINHVDKTWRD